MIGRCGHVDVAERHDLGARRSSGGMQDQGNVRLFGKAAALSGPGHRRIRHQREIAGRTLWLWNEPNNRNIAGLGNAQGRAFHAVKDDERLGIQIRQIKLELFGPVGGIERRGGRAAGNRNKRGRHFGTVRQHYANPIVTPYAHTIQRANALFGEIAQALTG